MNDASSQRSTRLRGIGEYASLTANETLKLDRGRSLLGREGYHDHLLVATERLIRWCISMPKSPAVLFFETFNPRVEWHKQAQVKTVAS